VFLFEKRCAEKLHKPKRKETVTELLRASVKQLERFRHPKVGDWVVIVCKSGNFVSFVHLYVNFNMASSIAVVL